MSVRIEWNGYGKSRVRLVKVIRGPGQHVLKDLVVAIQLEGDFDGVHAGDNAACLPTDTMKNTVYAFAREEPLDAIEAFASLLARHFLSSSTPVSRATVDISESLWSRVEVAGSPHPHTFLPAQGGEKRTARVIAGGSGEIIESGLVGLRLLKTTGSSFEGFPRDRYTTLKEARDRILATAVRATWTCDAPSIEWNETWQSARRALIEAFAAHDESRSVQHTLHTMGFELLSRCPDVSEVRLSLPNEHCLLVDLAPFGLTNPNEIFVPIDEPHGLIEATLRR